MPRSNKAIEILTRLSKRSSYTTLLEAAEESLVAAAENPGVITKRHGELLIPVLNRALKHDYKKADDEPRIRECHTILKSGSNDPQLLLNTFRMSGDRIATAREIEKNDLEIPVETKTQIPYDESVVAGQTGLFKEAQRLAEVRGTDLHTDDVLRAFDMRFPYDKPASPFRDLSELRDELAQYMELDGILTLAEDSDPLKIAADHRIALMKSVPNGPEPLWVRQLRWRCQIDLFFLARAVCGKNLTNLAHRPLCEHFVLKNPYLKIAEQSEVKNRLSMAHRGFFKSTVSILDCIQWIIDFPNDVRIIVLTATLKLAKKFIGELKSYFTKAQSARATAFQKLFPEFVMAPEKTGLSTEYTVRDRQSSLKDPTAWAASISSEEVGSHCDVCVMDDVETPANTTGPDLIEALVEKVAHTKMLLDPGGYSSTIGTPSCINDLYFQMQQNVEGLKVFFKPVMAPKPSSIHKEEKDWSEEDVTIAFPERFTWRVIQQVKRENAAVFQSQYMLRPSGDNLPNFSMELLHGVTVKDEAIPVENLVHVCVWDLAYSLGDKADSTAGAALGQDMTDGRSFVREIIHEKLLPQDAAEAIVDQFCRFRPKVVIIEDGLGAQNLRPTIERVAAQRGVQNIPLFFFLPPRTKGAKAARISILEPLMRSNLLLLSDALSCLTELYSQFHGFGSNKHDDLPDAIAMAFASGYLSQKQAYLEGDALRRTQIIDKQMQDRDVYDRIFGTGLMAENPLPVVPIAPEIEPTEIYDPFGVPGMR